MADPLDWAIAAFKDADLARRYDLYQRYADGEQDLAFATPKFESAFGRLFEAFAYNRCQAVIGAHTDRLHVSGFASSDDSLASPADEEEGEDDDTATKPPTYGEIAKDVWDRNRMDKRQSEVYAEALTTGDGYLLVWPDARTGLATLWPQRAANVRVRWDDERPGEIAEAAKAWKRADGRVRLNVYRPEVVRRLVSRTKVSGEVPSTPRAFEPSVETGDDFGPEFANPYGVVPIFHFGHNARTGGLGRSELRDVIPVQDALNKTLTDKMVAMELAAYPQRVILGLDTTRMDPLQDPVTGAMVIDPQTGQPVDPLKPAMERFQLGMDRILTIQGANAKIAEYQAVALAQFIAVAEFWDAAISRVSKVPVHYLTLSGNFPSGRALRTAESPFVAELESIQRSFGNSVEDALALALWIDGVAEPAGGFGLSTLWRSAAPMSEEDELDIALQRDAIGVPLEQNLVMLGWDADVIRKTMEIVEGERGRFDADLTGIAQRATVAAVADDEGDDVAA